MPSLEEFLERVASDSPTPGGGSVAALASSLGCALLQMVSSISVRRKEATGGDLRGTLSRTSELRRRLVQLVDEDALAYEKVLDSLSMPRGTKEERERRERAVQRALMGAAGPPLDVMRISVEVLEIAKNLAERGIKSACTDAGVAALMAHAGLYGSYLNVRINLASVKDKRAKAELESEARSTLARGESLLKSALASVSSRLSFQ